MATLLFWSIVLIPVGVFAFWSSLKELSTRKAPTVSFAIWIFAWAAVTAGLATNAISALAMIFWSWGAAEFKVYEDSHAW